jgi:hypothetical protein
MAVQLDKTKASALSHTDLGKVELYGKQEIHGKVRESLEEFGRGPIRAYTTLE